MRATPKADTSGRERLHKRIAASGLCSRRAAEEWIRQGRVEVNGITVTEMGAKVGPEDEIAVDGRVIASPKHYYLLMNKPAGYVTTLRDPEGRRTVMELLPKLPATLKPVGRLDLDTEGLLVFTNDGEFANRLAHPSFEVEKEYLATVKGVPDDKALERLRRGVFVDGRRTGPADVRVSYVDDRRGQTKLSIIIHEGRKRQVRLMCLAVGHPVISLKRVRIGPLRLGQLKKGEVRHLDRKELSTLRQLLRMEN